MSFYVFVTPPTRSHTLLSGDFDLNSRVTTGVEDLASENLFQLSVSMEGIDAKFELGYLLDGHYVW